MTELEATRLKLKCLEMVEGTNLKWWEVVKVGGRSNNAPLDFVWGVKAYELALGIVEGKPVWKGDELYTKEGAAFIVRADTGFCPSAVSWNPPKPKTVMVELLVEDATTVHRFIDIYGSSIEMDRAKKALSKALENLK